MEWCRCSACKHKMFMFERSDSMNVNIDIKCSSCKKIMNVTMKGDMVMVLEVPKSE